MNYKALALSITIVLGFGFVFFIISKINYRTPQPPQPPQPLKNQVTLQQLKAMTPSQINKLNIHSLDTIIGTTMVDNHGIPTFPSLTSQLSEDQYNAFWNVFNPDNRSY
jgi:hypothetical protein